MPLLQMRLYTCALQVANHEMQGSKWWLSRASIGMYATAGMAVELPDCVRARLHV